MARPKTTTEDVELARVNASVRKVELVCNTAWWCGLFLAVTFWIGIIAWAAVRITDKPAWLTFFLALLGLSSPPSLVAWVVVVRLRRKVGSDEVAGGPPRELGPPPSSAGGSSA